MLLKMGCVCQEMKVVVAGPQMPCSYGHPGALVPIQPLGSQKCPHVPWDPAPSQDVCSFLFSYWPEIDSQWYFLPSSGQKKELRSAQ